MKLWLSLRKLLGRDSLAKREEKQFPAESRVYAKIQEETWYNEIEKRLANIIH